ncbi:MAG TPA: GAF domain-containing SpoIIE family protein phosphatase [Anaerolineales bacterium]
MAKQPSPVYMSAGKIEGKQKKRSKKLRMVEIERQTKIQKALYEIATAASAVTDMQVFYAALHRIVGKLMYAKNFYVTLYDPVTHIMSAPYFADEAGDLAPAPSRLELFSKSLRAHVLRTGRTLHLSAEEIEEGRLRGKFTPMGTPAEDWIGVPLKMGRQVIGSLTVQSYKKGVRYEENDVRLLEFVAQHIAVALTRARAIEETRQRNAELQIINSVQEGLASRLDMQAIYDLVGDKIRDVFDAQAVQIASYDPATETIHFNYILERGKRASADPIPFTKMTRHLIQTRQFILMNEDMEQHSLKFGIRAVPGTSLGKSALWMPLMVGNEVRGVINLHNLDRENAFSDSDVRLLQTLASSMSVALENARLWQQEKIYRKALERELEIGREIQAGFLPEALPLAEGWEIAASLMSAREVAGDFYDAFELPDGNIGLVIADVCDKGVGAALFMTLFRSLIRAAASLDYFEHVEQVNVTFSAAERLRRAMLLTNNYIAETHGDSGMFATIFFGILDPHDGKLAYINGGHEPPFILRSGEVREILRKTGPAVGAITDCRFDLRETQLNTGDMLFAFTDGVPDCRNPSDELYDYDRLIAVLQGAGGSAYELVKTIEAELRNYVAGATQFDDITLLAVRRG